MRLVTEADNEIKENTKGRTQVVVFDMSSKFCYLIKDHSILTLHIFGLIQSSLDSIVLFFVILDVTNIDTAGILALEELNKKLLSREIQVIKKVILHPKMSDLSSTLISNSR